MVYLSSSAIRAADYSVPKSVYLGLISAASAGQYFNAYIRDQYRSNR